MSTRPLLFALALVLAGCDDDSTAARMTVIHVPEGEWLEVEVTPETLFQVRAYFGPDFGGGEYDCTVRDEGRLFCDGGYGVPGPAVVLLVEQRQR